jgi:hypothetical protein
MRGALWVRAPASKKRGLLVGLNGPSPILSGVLGWHEQVGYAFIALYALYITYVIALVWLVGIYD